MKLRKALRFNSIQWQTCAAITVFNVLFFLSAKDVVITSSNCAGLLLISLWPWAIAFIANVIDPLPKQDGQND